MLLSSSANTESDKIFILHPPLTWNHALACAVTGSLCLARTQQQRRSRGDQRCGERAHQHGRTRNLKGYCQWISSVKDIQIKSPISSCKHAQCVDVSIKAAELRETARPAPGSAGWGPAGWWLSDSATCGAWGHGQRGNSAPESASDTACGGTGKNPHRQRHSGAQALLGSRSYWAVPPSCAANTGTEACLPHFKKKMLSNYI